MDLPRVERPLRAYPHPPRSTAEWNSAPSVSFREFLDASCRILLWTWLLAVSRVQWMAACRSPSQHLCIQMTTHRPVNGNIFIGRWNSWWNIGLITGGPYPRTPWSITSGAMYCNVPIEWEMRRNVKKLSSSISYGNSSSRVVFTCCKNDCVS